jgi:hypothetical protein
MGWVFNATYRMLGGTQSRSGRVRKFSPPQNYACCCTRMNLAGCRLDMHDLMLGNGGHAVARFVEALRYKPEGRGLGFL